MEQFFEVLQGYALFDGISAGDLPGMLGCMNVRIAKVKKNQVIFCEGSEANYIGIVLTGSAQIVKEDYYGNRSIVTRAEPGELFGESFAFAGVSALPVSVVAAEDSQVMLIDSRRITVCCANACQFHSRMIFNLLRIVAAKNLMFNQKLEITSKRTTREKLMAYLLTQAKLQSSSTFTIPFDRQALADYLGVERSAMSAEISKLRREGVLESQKNRFTLLSDVLDQWNGRAKHVELG